MASECIVVKRALGGDCNIIIQQPRKMITTPMNFKFTAAQFADAALMEAALQAAILAPAASRVHVYPNFDDFEDVSEEAIYKDTPFSIIPVRDGNYRFKPKFANSLCFHKKLITHRSRRGRVFWFDSENKLTGTFDSDGNFMGLTFQLLHTEKLKINNGTDPTMSVVYVALANNKELDESGGIIEAPFVNTVNVLSDVLLTIVSAADDEIVVAVTIECGGTPVNGLVAADFVLKDEDGDAQVIGGATESGDGIYTLTGSGWVTGTINLDAPADLSVAADMALQAYETTVTIPT